MDELKIIMEMKYDLVGLQCWVVPPPVEGLLKKIVDWIEKQESRKTD